MAKKVIKRVTTETIDEEGNKKTVVKEHAPKEHEAPKRKRVPRAPHTTQKKMTAKEREELLIENFVGLQHAMTNMSIKFGALSDNISKLLGIFEESAKNFMSGGKPDDEEMIKKIDSLLNQNKTIAKGLVLMEGKLRRRSEPVPSSAPTSAPVAVPPRIEPSSPKGPKPLPTI